MLKGQVMGDLGISKLQMYVLNMKRIPSRELTYPPDKAYLKMIFLFPRWDMLIPWRVKEYSSF